MKPKILIVCGPTASGKSAVALELAQKTGGVIINADSQQLYRDLPILTARPNAADEALVPHKLYGIAGADESYSAGKWLRLAQMEIDWARGQGVQPVVVGGTGLYIKALLQGMADIPDIDPEVRAQATRDYEAMGKEAFAARLKEIDPEFFERLKVYDRQRLIRGYEVWLGSGKTLSYWQKQSITAPYSATEIEATNIEISREELYRRCDERFVKMIEAGAVEEVRELWSRGVLTLTPPPHHTTTPLLKIIGVPQILDYLEGSDSLESTISKAQIATRNYAKRQITWFKHQIPIDQNRPKH